MLLNILYSIFNESMKILDKSFRDFEQECILFCAGKTRVISNQSDLFRSHMLQSCQFRVDVLYFAQVFTTFVVYSVTNSKSNNSKNG